MVKQVAALAFGATLGGTLGAYQIGTALSFFLFGVVTLQVYYYNEHYENDRLEVKAFVAFIWLLELAHTMLILATQYEFTATNAGYGTFSFMLDLPTTTKISFLCSAILNLIFSTYCAYRIRLMTKRWEFPIFCFVTALARTGTTFAVTILLLTTDVDVVLLHHKNLAEATLTLGFLLDMIISIVLSYLLIRAPGNFQGGDRNLKRLLLFAVESGFFSFLLGIPMVITVSQNSYNFIWMALVFIIAKVNSNSILVTLNSRHALAQSYAVPSNENENRLRNLQFSLNTQNLAVSKTQVTTSTSATDDYRSFGPDFGSNKSGFSYPPSN